MGTVVCTARELYGTVGPFHFSASDFCNTYVQGVEILPVYYNYSGRYLAYPDFKDSRSSIVCRLAPVIPDQRISRLLAQQIKNNRKVSLGCGIH